MMTLKHIIYPSSEARECYLVYVIIRMFVNSYKMAYPKELKFWEMIYLGLQMVLD